jgi:hypothetical protein
MVKFGERIIERGMDGPDVETLQIVLSGFRGTIWDGIFGAGTELQVMTFKRDYMGIDAPDGTVNNDMMESLIKFGNAYPLNWNILKCQCGECGGFGQGRFKDEYRDDKALERYHKYEYPGIHKAILWAQKAAHFYLKTHTDFGEYFTETCGYRCHIHNALQNPPRTSTNHMGKAIDADVVGVPTDPVNETDYSRFDMGRSNEIRGMLVERSYAQVGWYGRNRKSLEPEKYAPTWIHWDVRSYERKYLENRFFIESEDELMGDFEISV